MPKEPSLFNQTDPYTSAYYFQDNLGYLDVVSEEKTLHQKEMPHLHDELEFLFLLEGEGSFTVNGESYPVQPGSFILTYPFHVHALIPQEKQPLKFYVCRFPLSVIVYLNISKQFLQTNVSVLEYAPPCFLLQEADQQRGKEIFQELLLENSVREHDYDMVVLSCVLRLMTLFDRNAIRHIEQREESFRPVAWSVLQYLQMHFHLDLDAASVAQVFHISPRELNSALRLLTGLNFSKNLAIVRIRNACAMMQFEDLSLSFIAHSVGYSSMPTFFRHFKEIKKVTPGEYREQTPASVYSPSSHPLSYNSFLILFYISDHYRDPIRIADAAKALHMSEATIHNLLGKHLDTTFPQLLTLVRLWVASGLLLATPLSVFDIAIAVGFNSIRTFNREFSAEFGTTPSKFRKSTENNKEPPPLTDKT